MLNRTLSIICLILVGILYHPQHLFSQNTPAEVGQNNIIWLEANDLSGPLSDGFTWPDKTPNGFDATDISDGSNRASIITNNGQQYLQFAGVAGEQLIIPDDNGTSNLLDGSNEFSVIAVFGTGTTDTRAIISKRLNPSNRSWTLFYNTGFEMYGYAGATTVGGSFGLSSGGTRYITSMISDASLSGSSAKLFVNSNNAGTAGSNVSIPDRAEDVIIGTFNSGDTRYFNGSIAEIIIYRDALNGGERLILENYLSQKYNIAIAKDYFGQYSEFNTQYVADIRGIGTEDGTLKQSVSGFSSGLQIRELAGTLNASDEFLMIAHDPSVVHADNNTSDLGEVEITNRWEKDFYLENTGAGSVDQASVRSELTFDFSEAGLPFSGSASDYVLLYRPSTDSAFRRVFAEGYSLQNTDQIVVELSSGRLKSGYYTLGRGVQLTSRTWYALQNGNWNNPSTWTLDAGVFPVPNNPLNETPGANDDVILRVGKTVTVQSSTNNLQLNSIVVDGSLILGTSSGHDFTTIEGAGKIFINGNAGSSNFPDGVTTTANGFGDAGNGGTLVINGTGFTFDQNKTFNDVRIELTNGSSVINLGSDLVVNGDLSVRTGTFRFGDGSTTSRTLQVFGNTEVESNGGSQDGRIRTNAGNARHEFDLYGNFLNEGTAYFTRRTSADYVNEDTDGRVDFNLRNGEADQLINLQGVTRFYRIEVNKGTDATYIADFQSADPTYFNLFGPANDNLDNDIVSTDILANNNNALGLISGTLKLGPNIDIPVLNRSGNYCIGANGRLWIDGATVTKNVATAIVPYGVLEVSAGTLTATGNSGITLRINGLLKVSGGSVFTNNIRTSVQGPQSLGGFNQTGGTVLLDGNLGAGNASGSYYIMSLTYPGNVFLMSGGTFTIKDPNGLGAVFINSDPANVSVTGGNVIFESSNTNAFKVTSRAPFYNLRLRGANSNAGNVLLDGGTSGAGGSSFTLPGQDLRVVNDLIIEGYNDSRYNNPIGNFSIALEAITSPTNINDVYVGGSFHVGRNSSYIAVIGGTPDYDGLADAPTDVNTTHFNQTDATSSIDTLYWGVTGGGIGQLEMGNFVLDRLSGNALRTIGRTGFTGSIRFDINGDASVLSGTLDQNAFTFRIWGDITNFDRLGTYFPSGNYPVAGGTPDVAQIRFRENPPLNFFTNDNSIFGNIRFNVGAGTDVEFNSDVRIERIEYYNGRIYVKDNTLTVDDIWGWSNGNDNVFDNDITSAIWQVNNTGYVGNVGVITDGLSSDGGLRLLVNSNTGPEDSTSRYNNTSPLTFPVGFTPDGGTTVYVRPLQMKVDNYSDDGYVQVRVVSGELQTSNLAGGEILRHYWRVTHDGFSSLPTVIFRGYFRNREDGNNVDLEVGRTELESYVPAVINDDGDYQRSYESNTPGQEDTLGVYPSPKDANTYLIVFNGNNTGIPGDSLFDFSANSPGFTLKNANFLAGEPSRFIGSPDIFYSRRTGANMAWDDGNNWSSTTYDGPAAGDFPQVGDVAKIYGTAASGTNGRHWYDLNGSYDVNVAEIFFEDISSLSPRPWAPRLSVNPNRSVTAGQIKGRGTLFLRLNNSGEAQVFADIGDFANNPLSVVNYRHAGSANTTLTIPSNLSVYPRLDFEANGAPGRRLVISHEADVRFRMGIGQDAIVVIDNNVTVGDDLRHRDATDGAIEFGQSGSWTLEVRGDVLLGRSGGDPFNITTQNSSPSSLRHRFRVQGDIEQNTNGNFVLYNGPGTANNTELEFFGERNSRYTRIAGNTPVLYKMIMNKGIDTTYAFSLDNSVTLPDIAVTNEQGIEILNGKFILNDPALDFTLANASTGDFFLPNTNNTAANPGSGAIRINRGILRVEGDDTGIILDGKLQISGGSLDMSSGAGNGNNFIEYSSTGNAFIDITAGSISVGSQVRRGLSATTGILKWSQRVGSAEIGVNAAPESNRGVFEIINSGSSFVHTSGDFTIVRQNGSSTTASLILKPDASDANTTGSVITIGNASTPVNQNNIGIDATIPLNNVVVTGNNSPTAKTFINPIELNNLIIQNGGTYDANGLDITFNNNLQNDGDYVSSGSVLNLQRSVFSSNGAQSIQGTGNSEFWNLVKSGSGTLTLAKDINVSYDLLGLNGTLNTAGFSLNVAGDVIHDITHISAPGSPGIVFNGSELQNLGRSTVGQSTFSTITIDNSAGVDIPVNGHEFSITDRIILSNGQFNIGSNILFMENDAIFVNGLGASDINAFNESNMITVNTSIVDKGIRKTYNDGFNSTFLYPVGLQFYTPVEIEFDDITASTPNTGFITVKPINGVSGGVTEDDDETCADVATTDFVDADNVLQYYWLIKSSNITDFDGAFSLYHRDIYESIGAIAAPDYSLINYSPARLLDNTNAWDKVYSEALFDEVANRIDFKVDPSTNYSNLTSLDIQGRYTAGVNRDNSDNLLCGGAIPDNVPLYITNPGSGTGMVNDLASYITAPNSTVPSLGESPDLLVNGNYTLELTNEFWRFRRVEIAADATLTVVGAGSNLGTVIGEGTIKLQDNSNFPAGDYEDFFPDNSCSSGGGVEYAVSTGSQTVLSGLPNVRRVVFSGNGTKEFSDFVSTNVCEDVEIRDNGTVTLNDNVLIQIKGDLIKDNTATFDGDYNNTQIVFDGSTQHQIDGDFTGTQFLKNVELNNSAGLTIINPNDDDIEIDELINLEDGIINTDSDNDLIILNSADITGNFSNTTHVDGPLKRELQTSTASFAFPVGHLDEYLPVDVINPSYSSGGPTKIWTGTYFQTNPTLYNGITNVNDSIDFSTYNAEVWTANSRISGRHIWLMDVPSPASSQVRISWNDATGVGASQFDWELLRVLAWDDIDENWESYGNGNTAGEYSSYTSSFGRLRSDRSFSYSTNFITIGAINSFVVNNALPLKLISFEGLLDQNIAVINWQTINESSSSHYVLERAQENGDFYTISEFEAMGIDGVIQNYYFNDAGIQLGTNYYRLKMVDLDGEVKYSDVISIEYAGADEEADISIYPNPLNGDQLYFNLQGLRTDNIRSIILSDTKGIQKWEIRDFNALSSSSAMSTLSTELPNGLYIITINLDSQRITKRLMINR